jgi:alpha-aminoadipate carrier protein LysW
MLRTTCPECGEPVELGDDAQVGERVTCVECRADLEVLSLSPLVVDYALADDWEDDWDETSDLYDDATSDDA